MWAKGIWLDYHAEDCGLVRKPATYAYGDLQIEGIAGTIIPKDFVFSVPSENGVAAIDFLTSEESEIPEEGLSEIKRIMNAGQKKLQVFVMLIAFLFTREPIR